MLRHANDAEPINHVLNLFEKHETLFTYNIKILNPLCLKC